MGWSFRASLAAACAVVLGTLGAAGSASAFPDGPVTMIVPFAPGGTSDQAARPLAMALERLWGQPVPVTNKPGGGSAIGMTAAAMAKPDGYTITIANPGYILLPATDRILERDASFDPASLVPIARVSAEPIVFLVKADAPWKTFQELVDDAKQHPGEFSYASSGTYGAGHIPSEMLFAAADVDLNHVAYQGGGPGLTALLGGHVNVSGGGPAVVKPLIDSGQVRALLHTGGERLTLLPDVPTAKELGLDVEFYLWAGLFVTAQVPDDILATLRQDVKKVVQDPEYIKTMENIQVPIQYLDGAEFAEVLKRDAERAEETIQRIGKITE